MLSGVLLHVVAAALGIDAAMDRCRLQRGGFGGRFQVVDNPAVFRIRNLRDSQDARPRRE